MAEPHPGKLKLLIKVQAEKGLVHPAQDAEEGLQAAAQGAESKEAEILFMEQAVQSTR